MRAKGLFVRAAVCAAVLLAAGAAHVIAADGQAPAQAPAKAESLQTLPVRVEVLLTPHTRSDASTLARALRERLEAEQKATQPSAPLPRTIDVAREKTCVLFNESVVFACLSFAE